MTEFEALPTSGTEMYKLAKKLFPICRSLTGSGNVETLEILSSYLPGLNVHKAATGTQVFDWKVPKEWSIQDAYIITPNGKKIAKFSENNLHVVNYSCPVHKTLSLEELTPHLHFIENQPNAIPYITSYYKEDWGFCITYDEFCQLERGDYQVVIDSELKDGFMHYAEWFKQGTSDKEVLLSSYICHPSMANNELSGPILSLYLAKHLANIDTFYSYRVVLVPETIGSLLYLSKHLDHLKAHTIAGLVVTCVGDEGPFSYIPSRYGNTTSDKAALTVLRDLDQFDIKEYSFLDRGSDERQYCSPGIDLPVCSITRSKYGCYPEYHTSLDNLDFISANGLEQSLRVYLKIIQLIELNHRYQSTVLGEPQMGKRDLYPTTSSGNVSQYVADMMNILAYCDGENDLFDIIRITNTKPETAIKIVNSLKSHKLIEVKEY